MRNKITIFTIVMYVLLVALIVVLGSLTFLNVREHDRMDAAAREELLESVMTPVPVEEFAEPTPVPVQNTEEFTLVFAGDILGQLGLTTDASDAVSGTVSAQISEVEEKYNTDEQEDSYEEEAEYYDEWDDEETDYWYSDDDLDFGEEYFSHNEDAEFDFTHELSAVKELFYSADFSSCTLVSNLLETFDYDSYKMPLEFAEALSNAGIDLVNTATDVAMNNGIDGLVSTIDALDNAGVSHTGTYKDEESFSNNSGIYTKVIYTDDGQPGATIAVLSYSYGTNGNSVSDYPYAINLYTMDYMTEQASVDYDRISSDIETAKELGADIIITRLYWWSDANYYTTVRDDQTEIVDFLCEHGVDIIVGGGNKVPAPIELRQTVQEDGTRKNTIVAYCLGNLLSCLNDNYTNLSAALKITVTRDKDDGDVWLSDVSYIPLFMLDTEDYEDIDQNDLKYRYRVYNLYDVLDRYEAVQDGSGDEEKLATDYITEDVYEAMLSGADMLQNIMGSEFDIMNGGVDIVDYFTVVH